MAERCLVCGHERCQSTHAADYDLMKSRLHEEHWRANITEARATVLADAIRRHRDTRGDDRCYLDDVELYDALGEPYTTIEPAAIPEGEFLASCRRFYSERFAPRPTERGAPCLTIRQLQDEANRLRDKIVDLCRILAENKAEILDLRQRLRPRIFECERLRQERDRLASGYIFLVMYHNLDIENATTFIMNVIQKPRETTP